MVVTCIIAHAGVGELAARSGDIFYRVLPLAYANFINYLQEANFAQVGIQTIDWVEALESMVEDTVSDVPTDNAMPCTCVPGVDYICPSCVYDINYKDVCHQTATEIISSIYMSLGQMTGVASQGKLMEASIVDNNTVSLQLYAAPAPVLMGAPLIFNPPAPMAIVQPSGAWNIVT